MVIEFDDPAFSESSGTTIRSNVLVPEPSEYGKTPLDGPSKDTQLARSPERVMVTDQSLLPSLVRVTESVPSWSGLRESDDFERDIEHSFSTGTSSSKSTVSDISSVGFGVVTVPVTSQQ